MANNLTWALAWSLFCAMLSVCVVSARGVHHAAVAPAPAMDCSSELLSLVDCLSFAEEGSKEGKPQGQCCPGLKKVVKEEVSCLCQVFKESADYGVKLNMTKALTLPSVCGVKTPPLSNCNIGAPGTAPGPSPAGAPVSSSPGQNVAGAPVSSSPGQNVAGAPAPSPAHSAGATLKAASIVLLLTITAALLCNHL